MNGIEGTPNDIRYLPAVIVEILLHLGDQGSSFDLSISDLRFGEPFQIGVIGSRFVRDGFLRRDHVFSFLAVRPSFQGGDHVLAADLRCMSFQKIAELGVSSKLRSSQDDGLIEGEDTAMPRKAASAELDESQIGKRRYRSIIVLRRDDAGEGQILKGDFRFDQGRSALQTGIEDLETRLRARFQDLAAVRTSYVRYQLEDLRSIGDAVAATRVHEIIDPVASIEEFSCVI